MRVQCSLGVVEHDKVETWQEFEYRSRSLQYDEYALIPKAFLLNFRSTMITEHNRKKIALFTNYTDKNASGQSG